MIQPIPKLKKPAKNRGRSRWQAFRKSYLKDRQNHAGTWNCDWCNQSTDTPDLHHIKLRSTNPELVYDKKNLVTLCQRCHHTHHLNQRGI